MFLGCTTTSVCRHPCLRCLLWDPAWLNDLVLPPTPPGTDGAETKLTPKAPELTPQAHLQPSVSNMYGLNPKKHCKCLVPNNCAASLFPCCRWRLNALQNLTFLICVLINCWTHDLGESSNSVKCEVLLITALTNHSQQPQLTYNRLSKYTNGQVMVTM